MNLNLSDLEVTYYLGYLFHLLEICDMNTDEWDELISEFQIMKSRSINDL